MALDHSKQLLTRCRIERVWSRIIKRNLMLHGFVLNVITLVIHGIVEVEDNPLPPVGEHLLHLMTHGEEKAIEGDRVSVPPIH